MRRARFHGSACKPLNELPLPEDLQPPENGMLQTAMVTAHSASPRLPQNVRDVIHQSPYRGMHCLFTSGTIPARPFAYAIIDATPGDANDYCRPLCTYLGHGQGECRVSQ
jgi:hypothetical protein